MNEQQDLQTRSAKRPMIPAGKHFVTLKDVQAMSVVSLAHIKDPVKNPNPTEIKWAWRFEADCLDPKDGLPFEHTVWTKDAYGGGRANLTKLLDLLLPRASREQKQNLKPKVIYGRRFEVVVIHRPSQNNPGMTMAEAVSFVPTTVPMDPKEREGGPAQPDETEDESAGLGALDQEPGSDPTLDQGDAGQSAMELAAQDTGLAKPKTEIPM